jgi:hypothetical protein
VVEGHILLSKQLLDLSFGGRVGWKLPTSEIFFSVCQTLEFFGWWGAGWGVGSDVVSSMWAYIIMQLQYTLGKLARPLMSECFLNAF